MGIENQEQQDFSLDSLTRQEEVLLENVSPDEAAKVLEFLDHTDPDIEKAVQEERTPQGLRMEEILASLPETEQYNHLRSHLTLQEKEQPVEISVEKNPHMSQTISYNSTVLAEGKVEGYIDMPSEKTFVLDFSGSMRNDHLEQVYLGMQSLLEKGIISNETKISLIHDIPHMQNAYTVENVEATHNAVSLISFAEIDKSLEDLGYLENGEWKQEEKKNGTGSTPLMASIGEALLDDKTQHVTVFGDGGSDLSDRNTGSTEHHYEDELQTIVDFAKRTNKQITLVLYNTTEAHATRLNTMISTLETGLGDSFTLIRQESGSKTENIQSAIDSYTSVQQEKKQQGNIVLTEPLSEDLSKVLPNIDISIEGVSATATDVALEGEKLPDVTSDVELTIENNSVVLTQEQIQKLFPGYTTGEISCELHYPYTASAETLVPEATGAKYHISMDLSGSVWKRKELIKRIVEQSYGQGQKDVELSGFSSRMSSTGQAEFDTPEREYVMKGQTPGTIALIDDSFDKMGLTWNYELKKKRKKKSEPYAKLIDKSEQTEHVNKELYTHVLPIIEELGGDASLLNDALSGENPTEAIQTIVAMFHTPENTDNRVVSSLQTHVNQDTLLITDGQFNAVTLGRSEEAVSLKNMLSLLFAIQNSFGIQTDFIDTKNDETVASAFVQKLVTDNGGKYELAKTEEEIEDAIKRSFIEKESSDIQMTPQVSGPKRAVLRVGGREQVLKIK